MAALTMRAQLSHQTPDTEVINRTATVAQDTGIATPVPVDAVTIQRENQAGALLYRVTAPGMAALVPALSHIVVARQANRIWVFGDTIYNHAAANGYVNVYDGTGQLVRAVGLVGRKPYMATMAENGALAFAGNIGKDGRPQPLLSLFDVNGIQRWSAMLPPAILSRLFVSGDNQFVAVSLYFADEYSMKTLVYDQVGRLLHTHKGNVTGLAFLPSKKMLVSQGDTWSCYDIADGFRLLQKGKTMKDRTVDFPIDEEYLTVRLK